MSVDTGTIVEGTVVKITNYGAFVELPDGRSGLVHIREIADTYVKDVRDYLKEQEKVKVKVLGLNERGKLDLSVKQALSPEERVARVRAKTSFEDKQKSTRLNSSHITISYAVFCLKKKKKKKKQKRIQKKTNLKRKNNNNHKTDNHT